MQKTQKLPLQELPPVGKVSLDKDIGRYFLVSTGLTPSVLFNPQVLELQTGSTHP